MKAKKITICALIVILLCAAVPIPALASGPITAIVSPIDYNVQHDTSSVQPGRVLDFPLTADMFLWAGTPGAAGDPVTLAQLRQNNVTVTHSIRQSQVLEAVTLSTVIYGGQSTAAVRVEFAEEFANVNSREFEITIHLMLGNVRSDDSRITLRGDFENEEVTVSAGDNFVNISDGRVIVARDNISNLEIYLGSGVTIFTRVVSGQRYYANARAGIINADMPMIERHPAIQHAVRLRTAGIVPLFTRVALRDIGNYYVYNASGEFLGRSSELLQFANLFYLSSERLDVRSGGFPAQGPGGGTAGGGAAAGSGVMARPSFGDTPRQLAARAGMAEAVRAATSVGSDTARLHVRDVEVISASELQAMFQAASRAGMRAMYVVDTTQSTRSDVIQGRIEINPAFAMGLNTDIYLGVYTSADRTQRTTQFIERHFSNQIRVIQLAHEGSYGMPVQIMANINLGDMNTRNLHLFSYDREANRLTRLRTPNYFVDGSGNLHFSTIYGGYIVVSEGSLTRRSSN